MADQEEYIRAREMQLQLQLEARRHAIPRFGPAVDGVLWSRIRPGEAGPDESPQTRILSILEFPLKPGFDVRDDSRPPRKLWDAALRYTTSIPGCCAVEWGPLLGDPPPALFCNIHWDSTAAWRKFQHSLGFSPLIGLLGSSASNRCAKVSAPGAPRLGDAPDGGATVVDVISVTFDAESASLPDRRSAFEESWEALVASVANRCDGLLRHSHAVWLENNASTFFDPTPAEAAAAKKAATFTAFLAWDGVRYDSHQAEHLCDRLRASLLSSRDGRDGPAISRKAVQLINQVLQQQEGDHDSMRQPAASLSSLASILEVGFPRRCSADLANLREHARQALARSISDARAGTRWFPSPQGSFISQGELYDGNIPMIPEWRRTWEGYYGYHLVDVIWMQVNPGALPTQGPRIYSQLNTEMGALPGFVKALWARDVEDEAKAAVLTVWEDQQARAVVLREYRRILDEFAASSVHLAAPLTHQAFPMARDPVGLLLDGVDYLELTCFHVALGALEHQLFEHAYGAFVRMTEPSVVAGIPTACTVIDAGGWQPAEATERQDGSQQQQLFTGALIWASPAARREWYEELFRASCASYELFGHKLDALNILAAGGVVARFLVLQEE
ncbi:hypothetical protein MFIFM68171_05732 [Madurella fahalii]|uniref:Uncharacterized protein n=1 Tax=Madurella fahalii TaxID=1157608 RepID=A0ABQ0GCP9_9PEZI